ncbi:hypothetical protein [Rhodopila globiformis]|uniref:Uncharacterized protein n=1 Tax=Rhodopila globiformis TaxID=1071 RepID=A0A2S6NI80_RHOGL|nr:hypothetical protein [Rhodopila globiformis]PPQ34357.1 hypothetical protein CCS01_11355 [Rhodopila globiformis]
MTGAVASVTSGLFAALRLARGRADGVVLVPGDRATVIRSFWSIPLSLPAVIARVVMSWADSGVPSNVAHELGREVMVFVLGWLVFVEITHRLAPALQRTGRWGRFIALWNWCNVIEGIMVVIGGIPGLLGVPPIVDQVCELVTIGWALWLEWYATRLALGVTPLLATALVVLDQSIGILLASLALSLSS